jgi:hypothetical protein
VASRWLAECFFPVQPWRIHGILSSPCGSEGLQSVRISYNKRTDGLLRFALLAVEDHDFGCAFFDFLCIGQGQRLAKGLCGGGTYPVRSFAPSEINEHVGRGLRHARSDRNVHAVSHSLTALSRRPSSRSIIAKYSIADGVVRLPSPPQITRLLSVHYGHILISHNSILHKRVHRWEEMVSLPFLGRIYISSCLPDHTPGTVPVVVRSTRMDALNEFRPVLARYQSTSWNRSQSRP